MKSSPVGHWANGTTRHETTTNAAWCLRLVQCRYPTALAGSVVRGSAHNMPHRAVKASSLPESQENDLRRLSGNESRRSTITNTAPTLVVATLGAACFVGTAWALSSVAPEPYMVSQYSYGDNALPRWQFASGLAVVRVRPWLSYYSSDDTYKCR